MNKAFSLRYSLETVCAVVTLLGLAAVIHQFVIGKHYIIPTLLLGWLTFEYYRRNELSL